MATLSLRQGNEGPSHDPYSYREWQFTRSDGRLIMTFHTGLTNWYEIVEPSGRRHRHEEWEMQPSGNETALGLMVGVWERRTRLPFKQLERVYDRIRSRCRACGCTRTRGEGGMPGESLNVCIRCGKIVSCDFNERSVI